MAQINSNNYTMKTKLSGILTLLLAFVVQFTFAQEKTVTGMVTDETGPLPGVSIVIKGTTAGTETDFDGNYAIKTNTGDVLVFSFIGMTTQEKIVSAANVLNIVLVADNILEEVVVTAFGIKRNPKKLGYAVSKVQTDDIVDNSEPDLIRSLSGKVAGVTVNVSSGVAGASNLINIRGQTTIGSSTQPLIVVDGIAYDNSQVTTSSQTTGGGGYESGLSSLDPNDIASVNVLKSVAAAALYGSRATNGVIVITTKSGSPSTSKSNKLSVSVNSGTYFETIANLPDYQNKYGNGVNFGYVNANGSWGPAFDTRETIPTWPNLLNAFPDLFGPTVPYEAQPNNVEDLFRTGTVFDNSVNLAYSGEDGGFNLTISDLGQEGYMPFNTYDRTSISTGGNFKLKNGITVGASLSYSTTDQVGGYFGNNQFAGSASSFARALWLGRTWDTSLPYTDPVTGASVTPNSGWDHPLWSWENDQIITGSDRTVANLNFSFPINDNISAIYKVGLNKYDLKRKQIRHPQSRASGTDNGSIITDNFTNEDIEATLLINFNYKLTEDIGLDAFIGNNILQNTTKRDAFLGSDYISPGIFTMANMVNVSNLSDVTARERTVGAFAEIGLSYKNYLFLNATGRNDWNSTLPKDNRSYFYPSASMSFIVTDAFKMDSEVLSFAKLRVGYAEAGRAASAEFLNTTFAVGNPYNSVPVIGNRTSLGDQEITPEFTKEIEIGADLELFKRRVVVDFSWYKKTTTDLISPVSVPSTSGFTTFNTNIGEMENTGFEVGLTLVPIQTDDFKWSLFTTFTQNDNTVTELVEGLDRIQLDANQIAHVQVDQPFGVFFGTRFARDDDGSFLIERASGAIRQDLEDGIIGDPNPDFKMSFINSFSYKGLTLSAQVDWKEGGDFQSISLNSLLGRGVTRDTEDRERTFIIPGFYADGNGELILDSSGNRIPNTTQVDMNELYFSPTTNGNTFGINTVDEGSVYDATVYRLREVSLSYSLPSKLLEKTPFGRVNLSLLGNNLWYFAPNVPKYTNYDPDVTSLGSSRVQGIEISGAPTGKRYGFKISLTF